MHKKNPGTSRRRSTTYTGKPGTVRCRARSKRALARGLDGEDARCKNEAEPGYTVCYFHGAGGGRPIVHGRYSKSMGKLRQAYETALADPELLNLNEQIAALDAVVQKCQQRCSELDTPEFRSTAVGLIENAVAASQRGDNEKANTLLAELRRHLNRGAQEDKALVALADVLTKQAQRVEGAWHVKLHAQQAINGRDLVNIMTRFLIVLRDELPQPVAHRIAKRIQSEIMTSLAPPKVEPEEAVDEDEDVQAEKA